MAARTHRPSATRRAPEDTHRRQAAIFAAIQGFRRAFTGFHRLMSAASGDKVSTADALALQYVAHTGRATPGDIGTFTGLTSGAVTTMLDRLEKARFIERKRSTRDRRVVLVTLRAGAHQKVATLMLKAHEGVGTMFEGWSAHEVETLVAGLDRLNLEA